MMWLLPWRLGLILMVATISWAKSFHKLDCRTKGQSEDILDEPNGQVKLSKGSLCSRCITIQVYHTVFQSTNPANNTINDTEILKQMVALNEGFWDTPFRFITVGPVHYFVDDVYYADITTVYSQLGRFGREYRRGSYKDLNIYYVNALDGGSFAFLPATNGLSRNPFDGVFLAQDTVPGASPECCTKGLVLVHEVGHWLGLEHTFRGNSCEPENRNDFVDDTPQQLNATQGACPEMRDSCPDLPGEDPIHNYMDYSGEECWEEFTHGQINRMFKVWSLYRENQEECPADQQLLRLGYQSDQYPEQNDWHLSSSDGEFVWCSDIRCTGRPQFEHDDDLYPYALDICIPCGKTFVFTFNDAFGDGLKPDGQLVLTLEQSNHTISLLNVTGDFGSEVAAMFDTEPCDAASRSCGRIGSLCASNSDCCSGRCVPVLRARIDGKNRCGGIASSRTSHPKQQPGSK